MEFIRVQTFTLTANTDSHTSNVFNAPQVYTPGGNDRINSLQDEDVLTGTGTNPTLNATLGNDNDNGSRTITPTLNGIQTVNANFTSTSGTGLDLQDATGLTTLNITRISQALSDGFVSSFTGTNNARVLNLPSTATTISISNSSALSDIDLSYRVGSLNGAESVTITTNAVLAEDLRIGEQTLSEYHVDNLTITAAGTTLIKNLDLRGSTLDTNNQTLTLNATGGNITIGNDTDGDGNVIEHNNGLTPSGFGGGGDSRLASITVNGNAGRVVTIGEVGQLAGFTLAGGSSAADIRVNITDAAGDATASFTTGSGADQVLTANDLAADVTTNGGADTLTVQGNILASAAVSMGAGNDTVTVTSDLRGSTAGGAQVDLGNDNNTMTITGGVIQEEASIIGGTGVDNVEIVDDGSNYWWGRTLVSGDSKGTEGADNLGGAIRLGGGNDTLTFTLRGIDSLDIVDFDQSSGGIGGMIEGHIDGGLGSDTIVVRGTATVDNLVDSSTSDGATVAPGQAGFGVTGVETLTMISEPDYLNWWGANRSDAINLTKEGHVNGVVTNAIRDNGADNNSADYTVDLNQFDSNLTTINLRHLDGVVVNRATEETSLTAYDGDVVTYTLTNLAGETINLSALETTAVNNGVGTDDRAVLNVLGNRYNAGNFGADVTLDISRAASGSQTIVLENVTANGGTAIPASGALTSLFNATGVVNYDASLNDLGSNITSLTLTVNSNNSHHVDLNNDFDSALTVNGSGTGGNLTLHNVDSATITTTAYAGNVYVGVEKSVAHTINIGTGNDVVRLGDDGAIALLIDSVNMGDGNDTLVLNGTTSDAGLTSFDTLTGGVGSDELAFGGPGGLVITGETDVVKLDASEFRFVTAFETVRLGVGLGNNLPGGQETAPTLSGNSAARYELEITNAMIDANGVDRATDGDGGFDQLNVVVDSSYDPDSIVDVRALNTFNQINFTGADAVDRLIFSDVPLEGLDTLAGGGGTDVLEVRNDAVVTTTDLTGVSSFEQLEFTNDLAVQQTLQLTLNQATVASSGITTIASYGGGSYASAGTHGFWSNANGDARVVMDASAVTTTGLTVDLTAGGNANDIIITGGGNDLILGGVGNDTITANGGNDTIVGGTGADLLSGGTGSDLFVINSDGGDIITDFATASDVLDLTSYTDGFWWFGNVNIAYEEIANVGADITTDANVIVIGGVTNIGTAAAAIAADADVTTAIGLIVFSDGTNTYVYGTDNLAANGIETLLVTLSGVTNPLALSAGNFIV